MNELDIGLPELVDDPDLALEPVTAAKLLAAFLKRNEDRIRDAISKSNYAQARRYVNGGSHGLQQFTQAYQKGLALTRPRDVNRREHIA